MTKEMDQWLQHRMGEIPLSDGSIKYPYQRKNYKFTLEDEPDETGMFRGYASIFGVIDSYNETVDKGAFKKTLKENKFFPLCWTHDSMEPLGIIYGLEDNIGLKVEGYLNLDVQSAREKRSLMKQGAINGLSIGFQTVTDQIKKDIRHLAEIRLWEISPCVFQACPGAVVTDVKAMAIPLTIEILNRTLIGWTTDKEFKATELEIPLLKSAGESINALLALTEPGKDPLKNGANEPQEDADILSKIISMNESFKQANEIARRIINA